MIVKNKTNRIIERIFRSYAQLGYKDKDQLNKLEQQCLVSILNLDEMGPLLANEMQEKENCPYFYLHGIFLCQDPVPSHFSPDILCEEYHEFCGIVNKDFSLPVFYQTTNGLPVYRIKETFEEAKEKYLEETFLDSKVETEVGELAFYFPSETEPKIIETSNIKRPYLKDYLQSYIEKKLELKNNSRRK